jgi:hypothetical protein
VRAAEVSDRGVFWRVGLDCFWRVTLRLGASVPSIEEFCACTGAATAMAASVANIPTRRERILTSMAERRKPRPQFLIARLRQR